MFFHTWEAPNKELAATKIQSRFRGNQARPALQCEFGWSKGTGGWTENRWNQHFGPLANFGLIKHHDFQSLKTHLGGGFIQSIFLSFGPRFFLREGRSNLTCSIFLFKFRVAKNPPTCVDLCFFVFVILDFLADFCRSHEMKSFNMNQHNQLFNW